ncbi:Protein NLRC3 [Merluccius polli]|nr:Protein NLRC3 [Merluccius polli]
MNVTDLLRLRRDNGEPVRTLVTTGLPGIGMSVVAARFSMDWAERGANKDIQFVIPLSFESLWSFQKFQLPPSKEMSIMEVIGHYYQGFGDVSFLDEPDCRFLLLMDSFDCYLDTLNWKKTPVVSDSRTAAHLDVLIVNLIRGNLLPSACIWILGRQAAVSNIPPEFIDAVTDIDGFSDEMKDDYLRRRFQDENLAENIVSHYKRRPVLRALCQQPFVCWLAATAFQRCYRYQGYGKHPPRITPFYIHVMVIQTNRKLQRYCGQSENHLKWSPEDVHRMRSLGKLALTMVKKQAWVFSQQDLKEHNLDTKEITLFSGLCTEKVPLLGTSEPKQFCFIHPTFQEFLAAMYIFMVFHLEGWNVLEEPSRKLFLSKVPRAAESAVDLLRCVVKQTRGAPHMDMVLLFLCGMMSRGNHNDMLRGKLFQAPAPQLAGLEGTRKLQELEEARKLLEQESKCAPADRRANLEDCLRELVQEDE